MSSTIDAGIPPLCTPILIYACLRYRPTVVVPILLPSSVWGPRWISLLRQQLAQTHMLINLQKQALSFINSSARNFSKHQSSENIKRLVKHSRICRRCTAGCFSACQDQGIRTGRALLPHVHAVLFTAYTAHQSGHQFDPRCTAGPRDPLTGQRGSNRGAPIRTPCRSQFVGLTCEGVELMQRSCIDGHG